MSSGERRTTARAGEAEPRAFSALSRPSATDRAADAARVDLAVDPLERLRSFATAVEEPERGGARKRNPGFARSSQHSSR